MIDQSPLGGTHVDKGSAVTLTISNGPGNVDIPSIVQLAEGRGDQAAESRRVEGRADPQRELRAGAGRRGDSHRSAGRELGPVGFRRDPVPQLRQGPDQRSVRNRRPADGGPGRARAGSPSRWSTSRRTTAPAGTVLSQSPPGNTVAKPGSLVTLTVASAPTTTKVPPVTGDTEVARIGHLLVAKLKAASPFPDGDRRKPGRHRHQPDPQRQHGRPVRHDVTIVVGRYKAPPPTQTTTTHTSTNPATPSLPGARCQSDHDDTEAPTTTPRTPKTTHDDHHKLPCDDGAVRHDDHSQGAHDHTPKTTTPTTTPPLSTTPARRRRPPRPRRPRRRLGQREPSGMSSQTGGGARRGSLLRARGFARVGRVGRRAGSSRRDTGDSDRDRP